MVDEELKSNAAALEASHCCLLRARIGRQRRKAPQRRAFPQQLVQQESQNCSHRRTATSKNRNIEEPQHRRTATSKNRNIEEPQHWELHLHGEVPGSHSTKSGSLARSAQLSCLRHGP
jgi:hypothetical protein